MRRHRLTPLPPAVPRHCRPPPSPHVNKPIAIDWRVLKNESTTAPRRRPLPSRRLLRRLPRPLPHGRRMAHRKGRSPSRRTRSIPRRWKRKRMAKWRAEGMARPTHHPFYAFTPWKQPKTRRRACGSRRVHDGPSRRNLRSVGGVLRCERPHPPPRRFCTGRSLPPRIWRNFPFHRRPLVGIFPPPFHRCRIAPVRGAKTNTANGRRRKRKKRKIPKRIQKV